MNEEQIVLFESVRLDYPFQLGFFVKQTDKFVFYNRLNHDPLTDETYKVSFKNVHGFAKLEDLSKLVQAQKDFSAKYRELEQLRKDTIKEWSNV